jgi:hypothetical protein
MPPATAKEGIANRRKDVADSGIDPDADTGAESAFVSVFVFVLVFGVSSLSNGSFITGGLVLASRGLVI